MRFTKPVVPACAALVCFAAAAQADNATPAARQVPAKTLPVPTDVSFELQQLIAAPLHPGWNVLWKTGEEWRAAADKQAAVTMQTLPAMRARLHVAVKPETIDGVRAFLVTPEAGIDAQLEVFEGMSHAQYQFDDRIPETREAFGEITAFFDEHLAR
jgi:epsilon-lactone hydrolase